MVALKLLAPEKEKDPQFAERFVREAKTLSLIDALRKMTVMPARRLEDRIPAMRNKGRLKVGADADVVVFDADRIIDRSTYQRPSLQPEGIALPIQTGTDAHEMIVPKLDVHSIIVVELAE